MRLDLLKVKGMEIYRPKMLATDGKVVFSALSTDFAPAEAQSGFIYIIALSHLPKINVATQAAAYICIDDQGQRDLPAGFNTPLLLVDGSAPIPTVFNAVLEAVFALQKYDEGKSRLLEALAQNKGIGVILNIAAEMLGNPLYLNDAGSRVIACSTNLLVEDEDWNKTMKNGFVNETIFDFDLFRDIVGYQEPQLMRMKSGKMQFISCALFTPQNIYTGNLGLCNHLKPFADGDIDAMAYVRNIVLAQMNKSSFFLSTHGTMLEFFFIDLLKSPLQPEQVASRSRFLNIKLAEKIPFA